jgi:RNA polymerase sigma factor (sigma-70 family)
MDRRGAARLPTTSWTLLGLIRAGGEAARDAQVLFLERYERPIRAYLAACLRKLSGRRKSPEQAQKEAEDLFQEFFAVVVLRRELLARADRERGPFRPFLRRALSNFAKDWVRREARQPRVGEKPIAVPESWERFEQEGPEPPERALQEAWVRGRVAEALAEVEGELPEGQDDRLRLFLAYYLHRGRRRVTWDEVGAEFGLEGGRARERARPVAERFARVLRAKLAEEIEGANAVEGEVLWLIALLRGDHADSD